MKNFIFILILIVMLFTLVTYILNRIFKNKKSIKYIPSIAALAFGVYSVYLAKTSNQGFQDIGYMLLGIMSFIGFVGGFVSGIFFDYILPRIRK